MIFRDKIKRKPRTEYEHLADKLRKLHSDEPPQRLAAILERVRVITTEIRER
jgi:hypothetical protein